METNEEVLVVNASGLKPLGRAVLCKPYEPIKAQGMIEIPKSVSDRQQMVDQRVMVIEIGPACWPDEPHRAKPGDLVLIAKMCGYFAKEDITIDGEEYIICNDRDIFCGISAKEKNHV